MELTKEHILREFAHNDYERILYDHLFSIRQKMTETFTNKTFTKYYGGLFHTNYNICPDIDYCKYGFDIYVSNNKYVRFTDDGENEEIIVPKIKQGNKINASKELKNIKGISDIDEYDMVYILDSIPYMNRRLLFTKKDMDSFDKRNYICVNDLFLINLDTSSEKFGITKLRSFGDVLIDIIPILNNENFCFILTKLLDKILNIPVLDNYIIGRETSEEITIVLLVIKKDIELDIEIVKRCYLTYLNNRKCKQKIPECLIMDLRIIFYDDVDVEYYHEGLEFV